MFTFISLDSIYSLLMHYGYFIFFPVMIVEGPIATIIAGFLASLGYFNLLWIYVLAVLGDLVGDTLYYSLGRWSKKRGIERWGKYIGITPENISKAERFFHHHGGKTLILTKFSQMIGGPVLAAAGLAKMPFRKFIYFNAIVTFPKTLLLIMVGFYFGQSYTHISNYLDIFALLSLLFIIALSFIFRKKITQSLYEDIACK